jgi:hypothetical protein
MPRRSISSSRAPSPRVVFLARLPVLGPHVSHQEEIDLISAACAMASAMWTETEAARPSLSPEPRTQSTIRDESAGPAGIALSSALAASDRARATLSTTGGRSTE